MYFVFEITSIVLLKKFGLEKIEYVIPDGAYSCIYISRLKKIPNRNIIPGSFPNLIRHEIIVSYPSNICKPSGFLYIFFSNTKHKIKSCCQFLHLAKVSLHSHCFHMVYLIIPNQKVLLLTVTAIILFFISKSARLNNFFFQTHLENWHA